MDNITEDVSMTVVNGDNPKDEDEDDPDQREPPQKDNWSSAAEFLVSLMGYSMGLADIWRLPYLVYRNGGGAFLVAYVFWMGIFGAPLYFLEIMMSQFSAKGPWLFWDICPIFKGLGISFIILNVIVGAYTSIIRAWVLEYLVNSFYSELPWASCDNPWNKGGCLGLSEVGRGQFYNESHKNSTSVATSLNSSVYSNSMLFLNSSSVDTNLGSATEQFWQYKILNRSAGLENIGSINGRYILYLFITHLIVFCALLKSVKSLGKMMYITCIGPIVLTLVIWIRSLFLPGSTEGMFYFINPDFSRLSDVKLWIEAAFMTFFTLGPGWGSLLMMGCHNKFNAKCLRDSVLTTFGTLVYGLLNGLVVFSVVGVMAEETGIPINKVITSGGFDLGFIAFPKAITYFPKPQVWAVIFFIIILLPGIDSLSIFVEPLMCIIIEMYPTVVRKGRLPLLLVASTVTFLLAIPLTSQAGVYMFQLVDWYAATWSVLLVAFIETMIFSWIYGGDRISRDFALMFRRPLPAIIRITSAFVIPLLLLVLFISSVITYRPPTYGTYKYPTFANFIGWSISLAFVLPVVVWGIKELCLTPGTWKKKLKKLTSPSCEWVPSSIKKRDGFKRTELLRNKSLKSLFIFNLTGKGGLEHYVIEK